MADPRFLDPIVVLTSIGGIEIDVIDRMSENYEHIITSNPTESGVPVTDNIVNLPVSISIEGAFSDVSISNLLGTLFAPQNAIKGRANTQMNKLISLFASRERFAVMDGMHYIKDMQFKTLTPAKEKEGFGITFKADLKQTIVVNLDPSQQAQIDAIDAVARPLIAVQLLRSVGSITPEDNGLSSLGIIA